jgi:ubiquinone/menaquinone biosynthesis C-methylase UbiE
MNEKAVAKYLVEKLGKINLSFDDFPEDYVNVNVRPSAEINVVSSFHDLRIFEDECAEELRASYVIERLPLNLHETAVKEWRRVLKPGGKLFIYCPDGNLIVKNYINGLIDVVEFSKLLFGKDTYAENIHRCVFDLPRLVKLCTFCGFEFEGESKRPYGYEYELGVLCKKAEIKYPY